MHSNSSIAQDASDKEIPTNHLGFPLNNCTKWWAIVSYHTRVKGLTRNQDGATECALFMKSQTHIPTSTTRQGVKLAQ